MFNKKLIIKILILITTISIFWILQNTFAAEGVNVVEVTESIPWANCSFDWEKNLYVCRTERWFSAIMLVMWEILKYLTFIAGIFAVLSLVVGWIMYSMWWANENMKTKSTEYIKSSLYGLILLLLSWTILYMIAPWVYV